MVNNINPKNRPKPWSWVDSVVHWVGSPKNNLSPKFLLLSDFLQFIDFTLHNILNCNTFSRLKRYILTCLVRRCFILQVCSLEFSFLEETPFLIVGSKYFVWVTLAPSVSDFHDFCRKFHLRGCEVSRGCTALRSPPAPLDSDPSDRKLPPSSHKGAALLPHRSRPPHRPQRSPHHNPYHNYHRTLHLYGGVVLLPGHHDSYTQGHDNAISLGHEHWAPPLQLALSPPSSPTREPPRLPVTVIAAACESVHGNGN